MIDIYVRMLSPAVLVLAMLWGGAVIHHRLGNKSDNNGSYSSSSPSSPSSSVVVLKRHKIRNEFIARPGAQAILSSSGTGNGKSYRGWLVVAAILVLSFLVRMAFKNLKKHGSLLSIDGGRFFGRIFVSEMYEFVTVVLLVYCFSFLAFVVELAKLRHPRLRSLFHVTAHIAMLSLIFLVTSYLLIRRYEVSITFRFAVSAQTFVTYMKMVSYLGTNEYLRHLGTSSSAAAVEHSAQDSLLLSVDEIIQALAHRGIDVMQHLEGNSSIESRARQIFKEVIELDKYRKAIYPRNVTLINFIEFSCLPVLVYEPKYPRTKKIDVRNFAEKLIITFAVIIFMWSLMEHLVIPSLTRLIVTKDPSYSTLEAMLDLIVPLEIFIVLVFYTVFECILGANAEILRLADREFYSDWWNATSFEEFSRKWNKPVHEFLLRHVHIQAQTWLGLSRHMATITTFIYSIIAHEIILVAMFGIFRPYLGFFSLFQIPLWYVMRSPLFQGKVLGNIVFWFCLTLAWPIMSILYCWEYCLEDERNCKIH